MALNDSVVAYVVVIWSVALSDGVTVMSSTTYMRADQLGITSYDTQTYFRIGHQTYTLRVTVRPYAGVTNPPVFELETRT